MNETRQSTFGPYECIELLSIEAANNSVYRAKHQQTGQIVALRVMPIIKGDVDEVVAACSAQLETFKQLDVPYILPVEDFGSEHEAIYFTTKVMHGGSLAKRLKRHANAPDEHPLPSLGELDVLLERLAIALDELHATGTVHGQVDPRSIMFDAQGNGYLADVGLTRLWKIIYGLDTTNSFNMSKYSAPELWEGARPVPASDQYSLACVIYELLAGRPPFVAPTIYGLMQQHMNDVALPPHYFRHHLPQALALPFWQALAKPPAKRHDSCDEFYNDFAQAIAGQEGEPTDFFTAPLDK